MNCPSRSLRSLLLRSFLVAGSLTFVLAMARPVIAQSAADTERARGHYQAGSSYFTEGNYEAAMREFERAYELSHRPALRYNLAQTHERLGHLAQAIEHLEAYLRDASANEIQDRPALEARVRNLRERLTAQERAAEEQRQQAEAQRIEAERQRELAAQAQAEAARAREEAARARGTQSRSSGGISTPALVAFIAGGVGVATFGVFASLAAVENDGLRSRCGTPPACSDGDLSWLRTSALIADIGLAVGAAGVITGVLFLITGVGNERASGDSAATTMVTPYFTGDGGGLVARGAF